jgi:hypothetical protein
MKVKQIVDNMIKEVMTKMDDESRELIKKFIIEQFLIPFWKDETGIIRFGKLKRED